jgi:hypothetical protein
MLPEPLEWVFHLAKLTTSEEAPRLGLAMILNLSSTLQMAEVRSSFLKSNSSDAPSLIIVCL